nr:tryptophanyl tRNA synthetase [Mimivirus sp.]
MCGAFPHLFGDRRDVMCLVPCAIDQAPYFRSGREMAASLGYPKPALICSKFLPSLSGINNKASTTGNIPSIFLNDNRATITKKSENLHFLVVVILFKNKDYLVLIFKLILLIFIWYIFCLMMKCLKKYLRIMQQVNYYQVKLKIY